MAETRISAPELGATNAWSWRSRTFATFTSPRAARVERSPIAADQAAAKSALGGYRGPTILLGGLSRTHDLIAAAGLRGLGYRVEALDVPDQNAFRLGKEFCNRGECNPAYFTIGNLLKYLLSLRDEKGLSPAEIIDQYAFLTAGACGPCRFGLYPTEFRRALRQAGFEGFRVLLFQQQGGPDQNIGGDTGFRFDAAVFSTLVRMVAAGDVVNMMVHRTRPYECEPGASDMAVAECQRILIRAFEGRSSIVRALVSCRRAFANVKTTRRRAKPKVALVGEFWAISTEGDGNYRIMRFLESEGAEVEIQPITAWLSYMLWYNRWDTWRRLDLKAPDEGSSERSAKRPRMKLLILWAADKALNAVFRTYAAAIGLSPAQLPSMKRFAELARDHYDLDLRGGEGHLEAAKFLDTVDRSSAQLVISVKPFGCLPSSGVSDGVLSKLKLKHPSVSFLSIETTGDAPVAAYSRIQMELFRFMDSKICADPASHLKVR